MPATIRSMRDRFASEFNRSRRGNLWRKYGGLTLTIFKRKDGFYGRCIAAADSPQFSPHTFADEEEALTDLFAQEAAA